MRHLTLIVLILAAALTGCGDRNARATAPKPLVVTPAPAVVSVPKRVYVPIDSDLTAACTWVRDGALADVLEVSRGRKRCLDFYEANLREIKAVQGTPVPEGGR